MKDRVSSQKILVVLFVHDSLAKSHNKDAFWRQVGHTEVIMVVEITV